MRARTVEMRAGVGWQYAIADLSLILFMVAAAALAARPAKAPAAPPVRAAIQPQLAQPVAVWRAGPSAPSLAQWLKAQGRDPRQRLTIVGRYARDPAATASAAARLLASAGPDGPARIVIEPGGEDDLSATLTWDSTGVTP